MDQIPPSQGVRFVTFNINGFRTLFHYHPWTKLRTLGAMFSSMQADIITLQELKVAPMDVDNRLGKVPGYNCFITVPLQKKGYSGVGVYVRCPLEDDPPPVKLALTVVRAEEGITGSLLSKDTKQRYSELPASIGGYVNLDDDIASGIDSEGRCLILEMANNTVIISVYCPANSMGTEEGEQFRVQFIECLFKRVRNLVSMGKNVVLMGDINISKDLIDSAVAIRDMTQAGLVRIAAKHEDFEEVNRDACLKFTSSTVPRLLLNELLMDSMSSGTFPDQSNGVLIDTVRRVQGRKKGLYTVWNTLTNSRPGNFGSRIDYILVNEKLAMLTKNAGIWPFLMGSDHCPVFTDFNVETVDSEFIGLEGLKLPRLEARFAFNLSRGDIGKFFTKKETPSPSSTHSSQILTKSKVVKPANMSKSKGISRNRSNIMSFFKPVSHDSDLCSVVSAVPESNGEISSKKVLENGKFKLSGDIPKCKHNEECVLKTAMTSENKGRKFWTCCKPRGEVKDPDDESKFDCGFFQWK